MVVVDKLSKETHFIPVKKNHKDANITNIFMKEIFCLHGISKIIISDRDPKLNGKFWKSLFKGIDTKFNCQSHLIHIIQCFKTSLHIN